MDSFIFIHSGNDALLMFGSDETFQLIICENCLDFDILEEERLIFIAFHNTISTFYFKGKSLNKKLGLSDEMEVVENFIAEIDRNKIAVSGRNYDLETY